MWSAIFPGQGSQHPGMGRFLFDQFSLVRQLFEEASDSLKLDFKKLCFDGSEADLALTENTQPCLLLVSTASYRVLETEVGFRPQAAAGHSIGEYAALVAAQTLKFSDAMKAVRLRGQAMQSAVPVGEGGMTAVMGVTPEQIAKICQWATQESALGIVQPANFNAPGQIVISGKLKTLKWLEENFTGEEFGISRAKFIPLKVSAPFHCDLMKPAEITMRAHLESTDFSKSRFPVVQNVTAEASFDPAAIRENLIVQISKPVRWVECVQALVKMGCTQAVEVGSGRVLSGLVKKIDSDGLKTFNINSLEDLKTIEASLRG